MNDFPKVGVVVLNWNGAQHTLACVASVLAAVPDSTSIVVCDNASRDDDVERLRQLSDLARGDFSEHDSLAQAIASPSSARVRLIHTGANLGYAGGVNVGLRFVFEHAKGDYAWVLNNDTEVHPGALEHLVQRAQSSDVPIGLCGATLILHDHREEVQCFGGADCDPRKGRNRALGFRAHVKDIPRTPAAIEERLAYVNGACMLVSRALIDKVGYMDESYFLYSEEHDWAERGVRAGFKLGYAPDAHVFHRHGATIGTDASGGSNLSLFYLFRNKLAFTRKFFPEHYWRVVAYLTWDALKFSARGHWGKTRSALRGLLSEPSMRPY